MTLTFLSLPNEIWIIIFCYLSSRHTWRTFFGIIKCLNQLIKSIRFSFIYIVCYSNLMLMYPWIHRSTLTGRQVTSIILTNIKWLNGLTIDFDDDRIYWADVCL